MPLQLYDPILVIHEYPVMARIISRLLANAGFKASEEVFSAAEAFEALKAKTYSLAIADWMLGPAGGLDLTQKLRTDEIATPILLITAEPKSDQLAAARKFGAACVVKPFTAQTLKTKIETILGARAA